MLRTGSKLVWNKGTLVITNKVPQGCVICPLIFAVNKIIAPTQIKDNNKMCFRFNNTELHLT